ncbi:MAG: protein kinase [Alphaproteobacteria bacterium]|nr:protein kinase [Alphaproteobacteria bacterium]
MDEGREHPGPGTLLGDGRYQLVEMIGEGGMAHVWRARDTRLRVDRAIKLIRGEGRALTVRGRRLESEARTMAALSHPHVVRLHDIGDIGSSKYIVMDYVPGGTLEDLLRTQGPLPPRMAVLWTLEVLAALQAAHQLGVIHRDVKPSNVLLDEHRHALLGDFGIALLGNEERHTRTGITMGSVAYMAPEQRLDAKAVGPTADVYAAGSTLYHLVTDGTPVDLFTADASSPRWLDVPEALRPILVRATRLAPAERYPTAEAMAVALQEVLPQLPEVAHDPAIWRERERDLGTLWPTGGTAASIGGSVHTHGSAPAAGTFVGSAEHSAPTRTADDAVAVAAVASPRRVGWRAAVVVALLFLAGSGGVVWQLGALRGGGEATPPASARPDAVTPAVVHADELPAAVVADAPPVQAQVARTSGEPSDGATQETVSAASEDASPTVAPAASGGADAPASPRRATPPRPAQVAAGGAETSTSEAPDIDASPSLVVAGRWLGVSRSGLRVELSLTGSPAAVRGTAEVAVSLGVVADRAPARAYTVEGRYDVDAGTLTLRGTSDAWGSFDLDLASDASGLSGALHSGHQADQISLRRRS